MDHVTYILFTTGIRMDEYHPWICRQNTLSARGGGHSGGFRMGTLRLGLSPARLFKMLQTA